MIRIPLQNRSRHNEGREHEASAALQQDERRCDDRDSPLDRERPGGVERYDREMTPGIELAGMHVPRARAHLERYVGN